MTTRALSASARIRSANCSGVRCAISSVNGSTSTCVIPISRISATRSSMVVSSLGVRCGATIRDGCGSKVSTVGASVWFFASTITLWKR